jgi:protein-tyrosine phosphatase
MQVIPGQRLPFEGIANFRDLGGYPSQLGGVVRSGVLFRSDRLDRMTQADHVRFAELGIRTIYDLRRAEERELAPDPFPTVHVCIISSLRRKGHPKLGDMPPETTGADLLRLLYRGILDHAGPDIAQIFTGFADPAGVPALFHCMAGKDRTGMIAALLLEWLGVPRELVLEDYELTNQYRGEAGERDTFERLVARGMSPEAAAGLLSAPRWAMEETLVELDEDFGGIERFLRVEAGLSEQVLATLRESLLES